jgi:hypothetical protein
MRTGAYPRYLPDGAEIARLRAGENPPTLEEIGNRYGVSRQAVHKALVKWEREQAELADAIVVEMPA